MAKTSALRKATLRMLGWHLAGQLWAAKEVKAAAEQGRFLDPSTAAEIYIGLLQPLALEDYTLALHDLALLRLPKKEVEARRDDLQDRVAFLPPEVRKLLDELCEAAEDTRKFARVLLDLQTRHALAPIPKERMAEILADALKPEGEAA